MAQPANPIRYISIPVEHVPGRTAVVVILQPDTNITAEDIAMLQALFSRNPAPVTDHLHRIKRSGEFMKQYYVGYGHKSIGDCASITVFVHGVSMLAAKALEHFQLFNGQEVSSRYVDWSHQLFILDGSGCGVQDIVDRISALMQELRQFYVDALPVTQARLAFIYDVNTSDPAALKALKAATFDCMRGWLPTGATTSLAITTTLRQFADQLPRWAVHPLKEVQRVAAAINTALYTACPNSFSPTIDTQGVTTPTWYRDDAPPDRVAVSTMLDAALLHEFESTFKNRTRGSELPPDVNAAGSIRVTFPLDYGSYRDLLRHRSVTHLMPMLTAKYGMESWYLSMLPDHDGIRERAFKLIDKVNALYSEMATTPTGQIAAQYFIPMGYRVSASFTGGLASMVYIAEIRSGITVHPTLRARAQQLALYLQQRVGIAMHFNQSKDVFSFRRGTQDIVGREGPGREGGAREIQRS